MSQSENAANTQADAGKGRIRLKLWLPLGAVLLAVLFLGIPALRYHLQHVVTDDAYVSGNLVAVGTSVSGRIDSVYLSPGDSLAPGDVVAGISQAVYRADVDRAEAAEASAESRLAEARILLEREKRRAGPMAERSAAELEAAEARLSGARAAARQAARSLQRTERLASAGLVSDSDLDAARIAHERRTAEVSEAQEGVRRAEAAARLNDVDLDAVRGQIQRVVTARAERKRAGAEADRSRILLANTRIRSPVRGTVARTTVSAGEYVDDGRTVAFLRDLDTLWVVANVEETQIRRVRIGQSVRITIDARPEREFSGRVSSIGTATASQFAVIPREGIGANFVKVIQRIPVAISVDDPDDSLMLGLSAVVGIDIRASEP